MNDYRAEVTHYIYIDRLNVEYYNLWFAFMDDVQSK